MISQRETEAAVARILTDATADDVMELGDLTQSHALISYHDGQQAHVLFRGHVSRIPNSKGDGFMEWELNAERSDAMQQIRCLVDELKQNPSFEAGFYNSVGIAEVLENRSDVIHWNRETGRLELSNLFVGRKTKTLSDEIFNDSLVVRMGQTPLNAVHVSVEANWTQRYEDVFNLAPLIARQFKHKMISTLTIKSLIRQWPRVGDKIGRALLPRWIPRPRGDWRAGETYAFGDWVRYDSRLYFCLTAHVSDVFETTQWELLLG